MGQLKHKNAIEYKGCYLKEHTAWVSNAACGQNKGDHFINYFTINFILLRSVTTKLSSFCVLKLVQRKKCYDAWWLSNIRVTTQKYYVNSVSLSNKILKNFTYSIACKYKKNYSSLPASHSSVGCIITA